MWSGTNEIVRVTLIYYPIGSPTLSSFAHPSQLVLFFRARLLAFQPDRRLRGPGIRELLSLPGCTPFSTVFPLCFATKVVTQGECLICATPAAARHKIFSIFRLAASFGGPSGRSCKQDSSQWIEIMSGASELHSWETVLLARSVAGCMSAH